MTNSSILKSAGADHCVNTSRMRFWAFSYSIGEPCERSVQVSMYFIDASVCLTFTVYPKRLTRGRAIAAFGDLARQFRWNNVVVPAVKSQTAQEDPEFVPSD